MPETDNIFTEIVMEMREEMVTLRADAEDNATRFLFEKVKPSKAKKKSGVMTDAQRRESLEEVGGKDALLKMVHNDRVRRESNAQE